MFPNAQTQTQSQFRPFINTSCTSCVGQLSYLITKSKINGDKGTSASQLRTHAMLLILAMGK